MGEPTNMTSEAAGRAVWSSILALFLSGENQGRFHDTARQLGVTPGVLKALLELAPERGRPMRELVNQWRCDASFVTVLVDGLEEQGFARRQVLPSDRRVKTVELTKAGIKAREKALTGLSAPLSGLRALTDREQRELARLLGKLAEAQAAAEGDAVEPAARSRPPRRKAGAARR